MKKTEKLNIVLNGKVVDGLKGETILELARRHKVHIPTLCFDPRLEPFSSCYVCVVKVYGLKGMQPACSTIIAEGMRIDTDNEKVRKSRKMALDLLLSNHYADCMAPCKETCPAGVDVQGYISLIEKGMYKEAVALIKETNPLPAVCGRVCVRPCEVACRRNLLGEGAAVGIDYLKRFASDKDLNSGDMYKPEVKPATGKKVAVIGAGPGGLSCGFFLQKEGHQVDIYEAAPAAGGWLRYGIPEYRLPNDILQKEVDAITSLGVNIYFNKILGKNLNYRDLKYDYDAVVLTIGSQGGTSIGCEGDDAENVLSGIDFLKKMELTGERADFSGKTVAVVGGGNTAMDCCRTSLRCNASKVYVIYRRTEKEMPANPIEIHESKLEGVEYLFLTNPTRINKDEKGAVKSVTCLKMMLGEPDRSGRRRPIPVEGSEFDIPVDLMLAAIGQKTTAGFIDDINEYSDKGEVRLTRWGDLEADPDTLQTGIPSVFAAGDGVTGPATLIEAIAQARKASLSCHQFLTGMGIKPKPREFLSKKDNFRKQKSEDFTGCFPHQAREEMPTLPAAERRNFKEVELGYAGEDVAKHETSRCLECGCSEYFTCDLKRYATDYEVDQKKFSGDFKEYKVDFRHPFIEIDNNKCILCARCVRICRDVVGANALGLVNRGFETYVAPSMGESLTETHCESCGMCISTCPTGAITENVLFKPGPVRLKTAETICNYCSIGCKIDVSHHGHFVMKVNGLNGLANKDGNICRYPRFGYHYLNDHSRIITPLLKKQGSWKEISFDEASELMADKIRKAGTNGSAFFAGARLTNEELYLINRLARAGAGTNNIGSFHYLGRGEGYLNLANYNTPLDQIAKADSIWLIGSGIHLDNAVAGFMVNNARIRNNARVGVVSPDKDSRIKHKCDTTVKAADYYYFARAANHYILSNGKENQLFIKGNVEGFEEYRSKLLSEDFDIIFEKAGLCCMDHFIEFVRSYNKDRHSLLIFSEKEVPAAACLELANLALITGKMGKTGSGMICLKEKNNSQGLIDMGIFPYLTIGGIPPNGNEKKITARWKIKSLPTGTPDLKSLLEKKAFNNIFIFGEDPVGCADDPKKVSAMLKAPDFLVVQDYFMTETAKMADLVLPASFPLESGGSFTNTSRIIQEFKPGFPLKVGQHAYEQLASLLSLLGQEVAQDLMDIRMEAFSLLPDMVSKSSYKTIDTSPGNGTPMFSNGCDSVNKYFDEDFIHRF